MSATSPERQAMADKKNDDDDTSTAAMPPTAPPTQSEWRQRHDVLVAQARTARGARARARLDERTAFDFPHACALACANALAHGPTICTPDEAARPLEDRARPSRGLYYGVWLRDRRDCSRAPYPRPAKANCEAVVKLEGRFGKCLAVVLDWPGLRPEEAFVFPEGLLPALEALASHHAVREVEAFQRLLKEIAAERGPRLPAMLTKEEVVVGGEEEEEQEREKVTQEQRSFPIVPCTAFVVATDLMLKFSCKATAPLDDWMEKIDMRESANLEGS